MFEPCLGLWLSLHSCFCLISLQIFIFYYVDCFHLLQPFFDIPMPPSGCTTSWAHFVLLKNLIFLTTAQGYNMIWCTLSKHLTPFFCYYSNNFPKVLLLVLVFQNTYNLWSQLFHTPQCAGVCLCYDCHTKHSINTSLSFTLFNLVSIFFFTNTTCIYYSPVLIVDFNTVNTCCPCLVHNKTDVPFIMFAPHPLCDFNNVCDVFCSFLYISLFIWFCFVRACTMNTWERLITELDTVFRMTKTSVFCFF